MKFFAEFPEFYIMLPSLIYSLTQRSFSMPYVNIKLVGEVTREQKAQIAKEITETLERVAHKPKSYTYITFEEVAYEDWAIAGELLDS